MSDLLEDQYLTLTLGEGRYAIPVSRVREVLEPTRITPLPGAAPYFKGIIDIRGCGVPVLDLRMRFGMPEVEVSEATAIVVVENEAEDSTKLVGLLTDAVHEVIRFDSDSLDAAPRFGSELSGDYIEGIGKQDGAFVLVLRLDNILGAEIPVPVQESDAPA